MLIGPCLPQKSSRTDLILTFVPTAQYVQIKGPCNVVGQEQKYHPLSFKEPC